MESSGDTTSFNFNLDGPLTKEQAQAIYAKGREAVIFALMTLSAKTTQQSNTGATEPHKPSGMIPPYEKPSAKKRRKKPGAKKGHKGSRRPRPKVTHHQEHPPLSQCPDCGSKLREPTEHRTRIIEDIGQTLPEVTEHTMARQWCPGCKKMIEPRVPDALPKATFGHRLIALTAWLHYGLGVTISQIISILSYHLQFKLTSGGLMAAWHNLAALLYVWYLEIEEQVKTYGVLHADETGWRLGGKSVWLWCFTCPDATYYMFDHSRGSPALSRFFKETFDGILITDFWGAYNSVSCAEHQACLAHLFRELKKVDDQNASTDWSAFSKKLGRIFRDAIRLTKSKDITDQQFVSRRKRLENRLDNLMIQDWKDKDTKRIIKRLVRYRHSLFTFLYDEDIPFDNNHAEREIRPAVIIRKNSLGNRSENGALTQAVMMSVYRTLKMRGYDPLETIVSALRTYVASGNMPPLPKADGSIG
jgi:transposase